MVALARRSRWSYLCLSRRRRETNRSANAGSRWRGGRDVLCRLSVHLSDRRSIPSYPANISNGGETGEEEVGGAEEGRE